MKGNWPGGAMEICKGWLKSQKLNMGSSGGGTGATAGKLCDVATTHVFALGLGSFILNKALRTELCLFCSRYIPSVWYCIWHKTECKIQLLEKKNKTEKEKPASGIYNMSNSICRFLRGVESPREWILHLEACLDLLASCVTLFNIIRCSSV